MRTHARYTMLGLALATASLLIPSSAHGDVPVWPDLSAPPATAPDGAKDAALVIAIENYFVVPKVPGAVRNGTDWYSWLVDGRKVPVDRVTLLRNEQGSREEILKRAADAAKGVQPGGTLWVVFIGHGAPSQDASEGVLVGVDAQQTPESLYARSVRQSELASAIGAGTPTVMVLDACFSGRASRGQPIAAGLQPLLAVRSVAMAGASLLTAGQSNEFAGPLPGVDRPALSYLVLGALRGWGDANGDGVVTAREAVDYARKALTVLPTGRSQTPQLVSAQPEQPLASHVAERGPNLAGIVSGASVARPAVAAPEVPLAVAQAPAPAAPRPGGRMVRIPAGKYTIGQ